MKALGEKLNTTCYTNSTPSTTTKGVWVKDQAGIISFNSSLIRDLKLVQYNELVIDNLGVKDTGTYSCYDRGFKVRSISLRVEGEFSKILVCCSFFFQFILFLSWYLLTYSWFFSQPPTSSLLCLYIGQRLKNELVRKKNIVALMKEFFFLITYAWCVYFCLFIWFINVWFLWFEANWNTEEFNHKSYVISI